MLTFPEEMTDEEEELFQDYIWLSYKWNRIATEYGNAEGMFMTGVAFYKGFGVAQDLDESRKFLETAAENNNGLAQYEMGKLYFFDKGIFERDDKKAYAWFKRSADNNYPYAGHYVAQCHIAGAGVPEDQKKRF